jgi:hypothetical protein
VKLKQGKWRNTNENEQGLVRDYRLDVFYIVLLCDAEDDHGKLRGQIEQLKTALEHAQTIRRRKIEYDAVTEKVNTLPSREELEQ